MDMETDFVKTMVTADRKTHNCVLLYETYGIIALWKGNMRDNSLMEGEHRKDEAFKFIHFTLEGYAF
jgi:hypothetical protein